MKTWFPTILAALMGAGATGVASASQEMGRVLSVTPLVQQVSVPQQVCRDEVVYAGQHSTGAGAVLGAVLGGVAGNSIGGGSGRAAATAAGVIGGAMLGNHVEGAGQPRYQTVRNCSTQHAYEERTVGYDVLYEYAGRRYNTRTQSPPGRWIPLSVRPSSNHASYDHPGYGRDYAHQAPPPVAAANLVGHTPNPAPQYHHASPPPAVGNYVAPVVIGAAIAATAYSAGRNRNRAQQQVHQRPPRRPLPPPRHHVQRCKPHHGNAYCRR